MTVVTRARRRCGWSATGWRQNARVGFVTERGRGRARGIVTRPAVARPLLDVSPTVMDDTNFEIMSVAQARRVLTNGDIKSEVAFQNDVNLLLASLEDLWSVPESRPQPRLSSPDR